MRFLIKLFTIVAVLAFYAGVEISAERAAVHPAPIATVRADTCGYTPAGRLARIVRVTEDQSGVPTAYCADGSVMADAPPR